ncbi:hypothetical protein BAUCODRAFT_62246 [Baudoinia panamericana UAMH 10762]|uniref:TLC domain-containing protein n=1 Tax=Baudoinia panamericana (strain UAMH 10762) TaxID=717646 RepID=M2MU57_BAUPA|nr:uncharacterized protein BAUCODRAFT_62246 [Baudoinia panamericana UAMH 10762]EMD00457.1 hypothetical protein BAUCODRAFT_62246 [Baudoinia panamericana UAMH 10762]
MRDPFPIPPPPALVSAVKPLADSLSLSTLPIHAHEVIFAFAFYTFICTVVSPLLARTFCKQRYESFTKRTRVNWDVHTVSFFQACIIDAFSLYIILSDGERKAWRDPERYEDRIWSYSGMAGLCQSFALGYFLWDLVICAWRIDIFGWGMLAHAISAVSVFALGYRPFLCFYCPVFLLYELSSPFLNIHWFCDKLELTGSIYQAINGVFLVGTFFSSRLVWGLYNSYNVFHDFWIAYQAGHSSGVGLMGDDAAIRNSMSGDMSIYYEEARQQRAFMGEKVLPLWLPIVYLLSNLTLNLLNVYWFGKMIETIRKRFDPPFGTKGIGPDFVHYEPQEKIDQLHKEALGQPIQMDESIELQRGVYADGHKSVEVSGTTRRSARTRRKA